MVYATIFVLFVTVEKSMNVKMAEYQSLEGVQTLNGWRPMDFYIHNSICSSVSRSITSNISANAIANSRNTTSGSGGGFSGGAGFGGGGGGGHGF